MSTPGFRSFDPALQRFFAATVINTIGTAALFGFVLIYFHEVRHLPLGQAGLAVGAMSFALVVCTPLAGWMSDRFGARRILTIGCLGSIVAGASYAFTDTFTTALGASVLLGVCNALWFPAQSALLSLMVSSAERPAVSAFQRAAMNLGAALGGVVGGLVVRHGTLTEFRWLFAVNVATYVLFLAVLPGMPTGRVAHRPDVVASAPSGATAQDPSMAAIATAAANSAEGRPRHGYAEVLADGFFLRLLATDVAIALGFGFLYSFMPAFASRLGIGKATIGVLFALGAVSVVITQIPTLRWVRGRPRMHSLAMMNAWFAAAFVLMVLTPHMAIGAAVLMIGIAQVLGGFGESMLGAVRQPLVSDLAPARLVGRYFGLSAMVFQGCMGLANSLGGVIMQHSVSAVYVLPLVASSLGVAGTLALRRRIPTHLAMSA